MSKFKTGDHVKIIKRLPYNTTGFIDYKKPNGDVGKTGYVLNVESNCAVIYSEFSSNSDYYGYFSDEELELVESKYTTEYKSDDKIRILKSPKLWGSALNENCPINKSMYPYECTIQEIQEKDGYLAMTCGIYGSSLSTLIKENNIELVEEKKITYKTGDKVRVIKTTSTKEEWKEIGEVEVNFNVGDILTISRVGYGLEFKERIADNYSYPKEMFELLEESSVTMPEVKSDFIINKWYSVHINSNKWWLKVKEFNIETGYLRFENISTDFIYYKSGNFSKLDYSNLEFKLLTDLSEIQEYLPSDHPDKIVKKESLVNRYVKRIALNNYVEYQVPVGNYDIIEKEDDEFYWLKTFKSIPKYSLLEDFELMPIGFNPPDIKEEIPLKEGDYITVIDTSLIGKMVGKVITPEYGSNNKNIRGIATCVSSLSNQNSFSLNCNWCYKDNDTRTHRKATNEEIEWLLACIEANKFIPENNYLKKAETKESTPDELLKIAKEKYPVGAKYESLLNKTIYTSQGGFRIRNKNEIIEGKPINPNTCTVYNGTKWAKVIGEVKPKFPDKWAVEHTIESAPYIKAWRKYNDYTPYSMDAKYKYSCNDRGLGAYSTDRSIITLEQFKQFLDEKGIKVENEVKEFILPEKWYVQRDNDNKDILNSWFNKNAKIGVDWCGYNGFMNYPKNVQQAPNCTEATLIRDGYKLITFEQFQKYVLKNDIVESKLETDNLKLEDLIEGEVYHSDYDDLVFKFKSFTSKGIYYLSECQIWKGNNYYKTNGNFGRRGILERTIRKATPEEVIWFEQCEKAGKFIDKETALELHYNSQKSNILNLEDLLAEAKRIYPEGSTFKCANNNFCTSSNIIKHSDFKIMDYPHKGIHQGNYWIVLNGKWAEIVSYPSDIDDYFTTDPETLQKAEQVFKPHFYNTQLPNLIQKEVNNKLDNQVTDFTLVKTELKQKQSKFYF